jgi:glucokinase
LTCPVAEALSLAALLKIFICMTLLLCYAARVIHHKMVAILRKSLPCILADIGGTHARCALLDCDGRLHGQCKLALQGYPDARALLDDLQAHNPFTGVADVAFAAAGRLDSDDVWRIGNHGDWAIDRAGLEAAGYRVIARLNDLEASAYALPYMASADMTTLAEGPGFGNSAQLLCAVGTGLGLAYLEAGETGYRARVTFGGHMRAAAVTDEQLHALKVMQDERRAIVSFEDLLGGRGLGDFYCAVAQSKGAKPGWAGTEGFAALSRCEAGGDMLRLYHEFLGLFLNHAAVFGHAFNGIVLDGGVVQALNAAGLLGGDDLMPALRGSSNSVVAQALSAVPVRLVRTSYLGLDGLAAYLQQQAEAV